MWEVRRRQFMQMAASAFLAAQLWAARSEARTPDTTEALKALTRLGRDLFPHDAVPDGKYEAIARQFMAKDIKVTGALVALLDDGQPFWRKAEKQRLSLITQHQSSPVVQAYRFAVLVGLYNDLSITRKFGYQGPSFEDYGYIDRGFNDLKWLPEPPLGDPPKGGPL